MRRIGAALKPCVLATWDIRSEESEMCATKIGNGQASHQLWWLLRTSVRKMDDFAREFRCGGYMGYPPRNWIVYLFSYCVL
jgi:hypothetical protein